MKRILLMLVVMLGVLTPAFEAHAKIALAKVRIQVVDQDGCVVPDAKIWGGFTCGLGMNDFIQVDGVTDTNGVFVAQGKCNEFLRFEVRKEGYYRTEEKIFFGRSKADPIIVDGKWQPFGAMRTVVLKLIKNPWSVAMLSGEQCYRKIPEFDKWVGFDFEKGDWTAPYGAGQFKDVLVRFRSDVRKRRMDYSYVMDVSFTNNPYAGVYEMEKDDYSDLKSLYFADTNATYRASLSYFTESAANKPVTYKILKDDAYLIFRTRTRTDEEGRLVGAHYGKIYGPWWSDSTVMHIGNGCFNPKENDPNIEGDQILLYAIKNVGKNKEK